MSSQLFNRRTVLFFALFLLLVEIAYGREIKEQSLSEGDAYMLVAIEGESIKNINFSRIGTEDRISLSKNWDLIRVKEGYYYLKLIKSVFFNVYIKPFPEPSDRKGGAYIKAGTITYIGEWNLKKDNHPKLRWDIGVEYPNTPIVKAMTSNPWVKKYPLRIGLVNGESVELLWK